MEELKYYTSVSKSGGISSYLILTCPICKKYKVDMYGHSKTFKCKFDFEKEFKFKEKFEQKLKDHKKV